MKGSQSLKQVKIVALLLLCLYMVSCRGEITTANLPSKSIDPTSTETGSRLIVTQRPTSTKTSLPTQTSLPKKEKPSETVIATQIPPLTQGQIFVVEAGTYGVLQPVDLIQDAQAVLPNDPSVPAPDIFQMGFSFYTDEIAYAGRADMFELWVGDVDLENVHVVWRDEPDLLDYHRQEDIVSIRWGVNDQSILLENHEKRVVVDLVTKSVYPLLAACDTAGISPATGQWAIWCPAFQETDNDKTTYMVMDQDGMVRGMEDLPEASLITFKDWNLSPDGSRLLYADLDDRLWIVDENGKSIALSTSLYYDKPERNPLLRPLRWSSDGQKVFVHAVEGNASLNDGRWYLMDSRTGELVWKPEGEAEGTISDAALSPDGHWIILFIRPLPQRYALLVSIQTNETYHISFAASDAVQWAQK